MEKRKLRYLLFLPEVAGEKVQEKGGRGLLCPSAHLRVRTSPSLRSRGHRKIRLLLQNPPSPFLPSFSFPAGCGGGEGYRAALVKEKLGIHKVVIADLSREACRRAEKLFHLPSVVAEIHSLPFKNRSFEVVMCTETLEHVMGTEEAVRSWRGWRERPCSSR